MEHLDSIHYERFYRDLIDNATLIHEVIEGETEDGNWENYYCFDDAEDEAYHDKATLSEYGNAFYFKDDKIYECIIYFENMECTGVNLYSEINEIRDFVKELLNLLDNDIEELLYQQPWSKKFLPDTYAKREETGIQKLIYTGNFGELTLTIEGDVATAAYQNGGTLEGKIINNTFKGIWKNKGLEGLVEFTINEDKLEGNWKKGLEPGPMKGKWEGNRIN